MMRMSLYLDGCVNFYNLSYILFMSHVLGCPVATEAGLGLIHQVTSDSFFFCTIIRLFYQNLSS